MAQTLTALYFHVIFSTKNRVDLIRPDVEDELYAYIGGILNNHHSKLIIGNGDQKHAHLLLSLNKMVLIPDIIGDVKRSSSKWLKTKGGMLTKFGWQDVLLVERDELTAGSTWHAAGGFHALNDDPNIAALQGYTIRLYEEVEAESGQSVGLWSC